MIEKIRISAFAKVITGGTPSTKKNEYWEGGIIPWLNSGELNQDIIKSTRNYITESGLKSSSARIMPADSVLIALTGATTGVVGYLTFDACANQSVTGILPSEKHEPKYLFYYLKSIRQKVLNDAYGGGQPHISQAYVKNLEIPLPPLGTQKRIAQILDDAQALKQKTEQLLREYDSLAQSIFLDMFGDPVTNSKGWEKVPTIKYCDCIVPGRDKPKSFTGEVSWITTADLNHLGYTLESRNKIGLSRSEINEVKARVIPKESVIMTCVGDLGIVSITSKDIVMNQQLHAFVCHEQLNNVFLMYNLSFQKPYMIKMASSTTLLYMNKSVANNTPTIVPPIALQNQFAEKIALIEKQKELAKQELKETEDLFNCLLQKAFKGELI